MARYNFKIFFEQFSWPVDSVIISDLKGHSHEDFADFSSKLC